MNVNFKKMTFALPNHFLKKKMTFLWNTKREK